MGVIKADPPPVIYTPTGIVSLDITFHGGLPQGRAVLWYGGKNGGKSTTLYLMMRNLCRRKRRVLLIDSERSATIEYFKRLGFTNEDLSYLDLIFVQTVEQMWDVMMAALESHVYDESCIGLDTLAKLPASVELAGSAGKVNMALQPRVNSLATRIWGNILADSKTTVVILNQQRANIGGYGNPNMNPGGNAIEHDAAITLYMGQLDDKSKPGVKIFRYRIQRSKVFNELPKKDPYELHVAIDDEITDVDNAHELLVGGLFFGLIKDKDGLPWKKNVAFYGQEKLGNGEAQILTWLDVDSEGRQALQRDIYSAIESGATGVTAAGADAGEPVSVEGEHDEPEIEESDLLLSDPGE